MVIGTPVVLNLIPGGVNKVVHVNQVNDNIEIQFQIMNGSQPYNVTEGVSCTIRGTKGDSYGYTAEAATTVGSNVVTVTLTEQLTAVAGGCNVFELVFVGAENSMKVSTENFILAVERAALGEDTVISDSDLAYAEQVLDQLQSVGAVNTQVQQNKANIAAETTRATAAEQTLQQHINSETSARQSADNTLQSNINAEASTRATQDASLQSQINQLIAPSGSAPSAAEVENARVGADGTVYQTLGDAIRTQNTQLKSALDDLASGNDIDVKTTYSYVAGRGNGSGTNTYVHLTDTWTTDYARNLVLYFDATKYLVTIYAFGKTSGTYLTPVQGISTSPIDFANTSGLAFDNYASVGVEIKKIDASNLSDADKTDIAMTTYSIETVETQVGKNKTDINDIKTKIGNTPIETIAETITGAIAELRTTIELVEPINKYNPEGDGYYLKSGVYHESQNHKWMHLNVEEGDVIRLYQWSTSGGVTKYRLSPNMFICAFSGDTVVPEAGYSTGQDEYTVQDSTINKIIISINVAIVTKALVTVNLDTPPDVETPYTEPYYGQKTDKTLLIADVAADAKAVGDKFANLKKAGVDIILPGTVYAYKNGEMNLYHKNVIDCDNIDNYGIVWGMQESTPYSRAYNECLRVTPTADTSTNGCVLRIIDRKTQETLKQQNFIFRTRTSPASALNVMFIGDSLTEFGYYPAEIIKNLSSGNVVSIGTRPKTITVGGESITFNHEGRSGWSAVEYVTESAHGSVVNAFWNPSTSKFDFSYYMEQNGFDGVDVVVIELGTNDASGLAGMNLNDVIDAYTQMVTSIQKYATDNGKTVKIVISLTTPSAERDGWANTNGRTGTPDRFDYYQKLIVKTLISTFEGTQGVWLASSYANLDTAHDFTTEDVAVSARNPLMVSRQTDNVHPSIYGYEKIADAVWAAIANAVAAS